MRALLCSCCMRTQTKINHIRESDYTFKPTDDACEAAEGEDDIDEGEVLDDAEKPPAATPARNNEGEESEGEGREEDSNGGVDG